MKDFPKRNARRASKRLKDPRRAVWVARYGSSLYSELRKLVLDCRDGSRGHLADVLRVEMPDQPELDPAVDPRIAVGFQPGCEQVDVSC